MPPDSEGSEAVEDEEDVEIEQHPPVEDNRQPGNARSTSKEAQMR